jgi:hypothetical protein
MIKSKNIKTIFYYFIYFILIVTIYNIISYLCTSMISYEQPIHITNMFTSDEIQIMQSCTNNTTDITADCYKKIHSKVINSIKQKLNLNYLYVDYARFSNNNNNDGQSYHRDVKPNILYHGDYPNVYTMILYLDNTGICIGNNKIFVSPGDIIIFNSFHLHKSIGMQPFSSTHQRRVLQLFSCFFDENEKNSFFLRTSHCNHLSNKTMNNYINNVIDLRWLLEYMNLTKLYTFSTKCSNINNPDFFSIINEQNYIATIDNVKYYRDL